MITKNITGIVLLQSDEVVEQSNRIEHTFVTVNVASKVLRASPRSVQKMFDNGLLHGHRLKTHPTAHESSRKSGGDRRIRLLSLVSYLQNNDMEDIADEIVGGRPRLFVGALPDNCTGGVTVEETLVGATGAAVDSYFLPAEVIIDFTSEAFPIKDVKAFLNRLTIRSAKFAASLLGRAKNERAIADRCRTQVTFIIPSDWSDERRASLEGIARVQRGLSDGVLKPVVVAEKDRHLIDTQKCVVSNFPEL